jgi:hypothetical protein
MQTRHTLKTSTNWNHSFNKRIVRMYFEEVIAEIAMFMFLFHAQHDVLRFSNNKKNEIL